MFIGESGCFEFVLVLGFEDLGENVLELAVICLEDGVLGGQVYRVSKFLVRGVRSAKDFEYEREQADINKQLGGVETILLFSDPRYSSISSTLVRELRFFGREVDEFLPKAKV